MHYSDRTPLSWAAERGHKDIVALLLAHGANPDDEVPLPDQISSPLLVAISKGHKEIIEMLLDTMIDMTRERRYGLRIHGGGLNSTLGISAPRLAIHSLAIFHVLLGKGIRFDSKPFESYILTTEVLTSGKLTLAQAILDIGAPVNEPEESLSQGMGSIVVHAAKGGTNMLDFLSARGLLITEPTDSNVQQAMWEAVGEGYTAIVEYLLKRGCRPCREKERTGRSTCLEQELGAKDPKSATATLDLLQGSLLSQSKETSPMM